MELSDNPSVLSKIDFSKRDVYNFIRGKPYNKIKTNYKTVIYVATPMVEESVTIIPLRYVVDLAYA